VLVGVRLAQVGEFDVVREQSASAGDANWRTFMEDGGFSCCRASPSAPRARVIGHNLALPISSHARIINAVTPRPAFTLAENS